MSNFMPNNEQMISKTIRGRGSNLNPSNRFEPFAFIPDVDECPEDMGRPQTRFFTEKTRSIITYNNSPDIPFDASLNPYRGCEHGCIYCYARPTHEYLGFSAGLDFETRIIVKPDAPELLRKELSRKSWKPQTLTLSGITDPYQPIEKSLRITHGCLKVLLEFHNPVSIITKNHLITRDIDILAQMAQQDCVTVYISLTSLNPELTQILEPRTSRPQRRLEAIEKLTAAGIPTGILMAPIIPAINDGEISTVLQAASQAGAEHASYVFLRLPYAVKDLFVNWLDQHFPERKEKVLNTIRHSRGGKLNDPNFKTRMRGEGIFAEQIKQLFRLACQQAGLNKKRPRLTTDGFRVPEKGQIMMF